MADILDKINAYKRQEIAAAKLRRPLKDLKRDAQMAGPPRSFVDGDRRPRQPLANSR